MPDINIDVTLDTGEVDRLLDKAIDAVTPPSLTESLGDGADAFVDALRAAAPVRTGRLAASMDKTPDGDDAWLVGPDQNIPYARIQNSGGDIYPHLPRQFLRFVIDGKVIFARHVYIPGTHYMETGFELGRGPAIENVLAGVDRKLHEPL